MSSAKTPNLGLNQWSKDDYVLREEFNADNSIIDAALADVGGIEFIKEVSTSADAAQVDVDVSDIDWGQYHEVYLDIISPVNGSTLLTYFNFTFNNINDDNTAYTWKSGTTAQTNAKYAGQIEFTINNDKYQRISFLPYKAADKQVTYWVQNDAMVEYGFTHKVKFNALNTVNFVATNSSKPIRESTVFKFWGVK